jgi:hypothetical protein
VAQSFKDIKLRNSNLNVFLDPTKVPNLWGLELVDSTLNIFPAEILTQRPAQVNAAILASKRETFPSATNSPPVAFIGAPATGEVLGEVTDQDEGRGQRKQKTKEKGKRNRRRSGGVS